MDRIKTLAVIAKQKELAPGIFDLTLIVPQIASRAVPGQFANIYLNDRARILPRPLSLCGIDPEEGTIRIVYRVSGERTGTELLSGYRPGRGISVMGPLGNGFPAGEDMADSCVVGGGIGIPPLLALSKALPGSTTAVLGYRNADLFLKDEFDAACPDVLVATENGSVGTKGTVIDAMEAAGLKPKRILACGPLPMLRALKTWAAEREIPLWVSMEERMACGIGACLGCVVKTTGIDGHSKVKNARVCADGPVFRAEEVKL